MKYASEYFPGSVSKQCTLNSHSKHPWSVQNSLFEREKYVPAVNGFSLNDWDKGYSYCRMNQRTHSLEHLKIFLWQGDTEQHRRPLSRQCWKPWVLPKKTVLSFSTLNLLCALCAQSCLTFCSALDCSLPGSSAHGILQARILEWVAISSPRGSS